jgi:hypothetical protein
VFKSELVLQAGRRHRWIVREPLVWQPHRLGSTAWTRAPITVPIGFQTDLASIPRIIQWLPHMGVNGRSRRAAVLHDYLYRTPGYRKADADLVFAAALSAENVATAAIWLMYYAVKWFGKKP